MTAPRRRPVTQITGDQILTPGDPAPQTGLHLCRPPSLPPPGLEAARAPGGQAPGCAGAPALQHPGRVSHSPPSRVDAARSPGPTPRSSCKTQPAAHPLLSDQSRLLRPQDWRASAGWGGPLGRLSGCGPRKLPWSGGRPRSRSRRAHEGRVLKLLFHLALEKFQ